MEILTLLIAIIAVIISFISLYRTRKFNEQQIIFQEETHKLAQLQRSLLEEQQAEKYKSGLSLYIYNAVNGERLGVINSGNVEIKNVTVELVPKEGYCSPLVSSDCEEKLPVSIMVPGDEFNLLLAMCDDTGTTFTAKTQWQTEDGKTHNHEKLLTY